MAAETYCLELDTLLSVGELQDKEGPVMTHVVNFIPPTQPFKARWQRERGKRKTHVMAVTSLCGIFKETVALLKQCMWESTK